MGEFKSPTKLSRLYEYEVDGRLVVTNVDPVFLARLPYDGRVFLERLAREHGRPVQDGAA